MLQLMAGQAARDLWKPRARHLAQVALPEPLARLAPLLLLADCSVKAVAVVVEARMTRVVLAAQVVAAQAAVAARVAAAHTRPALVVSAAMDGHWFWSFDHAAICRG